jgi:hypothetical protein
MFVKKGSAVSIVFGMILGSTSLFAAGNLALTGHDDDLHQSTAARAQGLAMINFARNGSTLKVLSFDHGSQLQTFLTEIGIAFDNVDPDVGVPAATLFNHAIYSAIVIASDQSCGGCDNTTTSSSNLAAAKTNFASFVNAGGGIVAFAGADNTNYYGFLPASANNPGTVSCSSCFTQTAAGVTVGIPAVNTDFPHNFFAVPGTAGMDPNWKVAESYSGASSAGTLTNQPFTVFAQNVGVTGTGLDTGGGGTPTPTVPIGWPALLAIAIGLGGMSLFQYRRMLKRS